jgi:hypothetical protein
MRHYIIHFWQQLPNHVQIDLDALKSLDLNFYSTLEDIYLKLDASLDHLRHLYAIATLNPLWLNKALDNYGIKAVRELKLEQAFKWKCRVKSKFQLIAIAKVSIKSEKFKISNSTPTPTPFRLHGVELE